MRPNSGIGVVQRHVYPRLAERFEIVYSPTRDRQGSRLGAVVGLLAGFIPPRRPVSRHINLVSPLPFLVRAPVTTVVHDLRWMRTRGTVARYYRAWDLRRAVRKSDRLVCISRRTYTDLVEFAPDAASKAVVAWLGPGLLPEDSFLDRDNGEVLLIGGARHKRNELAAAALAAARPSWLQSVVGVGVSESVRDILEGSLGVERCTWHDRVSDEVMVSIYRSAETYLHLGLDEGFGLPYVEALGAGSQVVVVNQPLTRELLGDAAMYVDDGSAVEIAAQLEVLTPTESVVRRARAKRFSWQTFADALA